MTAYRYSDTSLSSLNGELLRVQDPPPLLFIIVPPGSSTESDLEQMFINAGWVDGGETGGERREASILE